VVRARNVGQRARQNDRQIDRAGRQTGRADRQTGRAGSVLAGTQIEQTEQTDSPVERRQDEHKKRWKKMKRWKR
jgi:hypothetical protein